MNEPNRRTWLFRHAAGAILAVTAVSVPLIPLAAVVGLNAKTHSFSAAIILRPALIGALGAALLILATGLLWPSLEQRAAGVTLFLLAFLMYPFWPHSTVVGLAIALASVYVCASAAVCILAARQLRPPWTHVLSFAVAVPVIWNLLALGLQRQWAPRPWEHEVRRIIDASSRFSVPDSREHADIFYIVVDGFARPDVLQTLFDVDAGSHVARLKAAGVVLPGRARSNYSQTFLSLASSLNMEYLDGLARVMKDDNDRRPLNDLIQGSGVITRLKQAGYRFVMIGSDTAIAGRHQMADVCFCSLPPGLSELEFILLDRTPLGAFDLDSVSLNAHRLAVLRSLDAIESIETGVPAAPVVVFAHVFAPHPPFVLARNGAASLQRAYSHQDGNLFPGTAAEYVNGYREQASFVLERLTKLILNLLTRPRPPVIVVVGDHGSGLHMNNSDVRKTDSWERVSIFSAYFARKPGLPVPDDMSPVNALRWAVASATGAKLPLLPNRSYLSSYERPYRFWEVEQIGRGLRIQESEAIALDRRQ